MEDNPILKKITEAKGKYLSDLDQGDLNSWEKRAKKALLITSLKDHDGIRIIVDSFTSDIVSINEIILHDLDLSKEERLRLIDRRVMYNKFLQFFTDAERDLENVEKQLDENIV